MYELLIIGNLLILVKLVEICVKELDNYLLKSIIIKIILLRMTLILLHQLYGYEK